MDIQEEMNAIINKLSAQLLNRARDEALNEG